MNNITDEQRKAALGAIGTYEAKCYVGLIWGSKEFRQMEKNYHTIRSALEPKTVTREFIADIIGWLTGDLTEGDKVNYVIARLKEKGINVVNDQFDKGNKIIFNEVEDDPDIHEVTDR